ncbi:MAG: hypothetical protein NTV21_00330 [Planctomycetota bacterium]|nr:hypothetical protein [Planctomycetota bacterium]
MEGTGGEGELAAAVGPRFAFLAEYGLERGDVDPEWERHVELVRYVAPDLEVVVYRERMSGEVGLNFRVTEGHFSCSDILRLSDREAAECRRDRVARNREALAEALDELREFLLIHALPVLRRDAQFFAQVLRERSASARERHLVWEADRLRPMAETAFHERRFAEAVALFEQFPDRLTVLDRAKLALARRRLSS